jgi:hypothetical protein
MNTTGFDALRNASPLAPDRAWQLWLLLNNFQQSLWEAYETPFVEFCLRKEENEQYVADPPVLFD